MEERKNEERERDAQDAPAAPLIGRAPRGMRMIAMGVGILIVLVASIWRCG